MFLMALWATSSILAQSSTEAESQALTTPPPAIAFAPWREVDNDEFSRIYDESFPSAFTTSYPENNTVRLRVYVPNDIPGPFPTVVVLHYWGATDLSLEDDMARELNTLGVAAVIMVLPYHLSRTPHGFRSGELAVQADPQKLVASMTQSILDVRRTVDWIQTKSEFRPDHVGVAGTSLGGIVASLAFAIDPRFTCGTFALAGADIAGILWNSSKVVAQREALRRRGYTEERLRKELAAIEPGKYLKSQTGRRTLVIAAKYDTVVPPVFAQKLIDDLGGDPAVWMDTGHFGGAFIRGRIVRLVARFFESTFRGQAFEPPATIHALTFRFGLVYSDERGLQVALSTDVWHGDKKGDTFAAVMLTPQGVEGLIGHRAGHGLSVGILVLPRKPTLGLNWSVAF